jgi:hypothetical protein
MERHYQHEFDGYVRMKIKPFKYKKIKKAQQGPVVDVTPGQEVESQYTGQIDGYKASQGEENFLKAAYKNGGIMNHIFRMSLGAPRNKPGYKELDFLLTSKSGEHIAIQIRDYDFIHKGQSSEGKDMATDSFLLQELAKEGVTVRGNKILTVSDDDVATPELAKRAVEDIL